VCDDQHFSEVAVEELVVDPSMPAVAPSCPPAISDEDHTVTSMVADSNGRDGVQTAELAP
jgi:hypothetical protein